MFALNTQQKKMCKYFKIFLLKSKKEKQLLWLAHPGAEKALLLVLLKDSMILRREMFL